MYDKALEDWFNGITLETIERWVEEKVSEDLYLEFKTEPKDGDLRKVLGKLVSAFGNGAGGICVWGILAGNDEDGIDRIKGEKPLGNPARFASRLADLGMGATAPGHAGVQHKVLKRDDGTGFVVTIVPPFDGQPLMSLVDHVYRVRTCKGVAPMEHFQVADMFGRRARPLLSLEIVKLAVGHGIVNGWEVAISVRNFGRTLARDLAVAIRVEPPWYVPSVQSFFRGHYMKSESGEDFHLWSPPGGYSHCHVGQALYVGVLAVKNLAHFDAIPDLVLHARIMARDVMPTNCHMDIRFEDIPQQ